MFYEFAIEPIVLSNWKDCKYIVEKLGVPRGRVVSRFPKEWFRFVLEACSDLGDSERKKISVALNKIKKYRSIPANRGYDRTRNWCDNVLMQTAEIPFHGIISRTNLDVRESILFDELDEDHPRFKIARDRRIKRTVEGIVDSVLPFLNSAKKFKFVDPYFSSVKHRHILPLIEMLKKITARSNQELPCSISYHFNDRISTDIFLHELKTKVEYLIPEKIKIDFYQWPESKMHNRFILTDIGGVKFGTGLDIDERDFEQTDLINLLSETTFKEEWDEFPYNQDQLIYTIDKT
jgi:hypothetical protein